MSRVSAEFHANQRVKGNSSMQHQEVPGNHGHHCVRVVEQDNESNVSWRASEWHAKVLGLIWMTRDVCANIYDLCPIIVTLPELERDNLSGKLESMRVPECEGVCMRV